MSTSDLHARINELAQTELTADNRGSEPRPLVDDDGSVVVAVQGEVEGLTGHIVCPVHPVVSLPVWDGLPALCWACAQQTRAEAYRRSKEQGR